VRREADSRGDGWAVGMMDTLLAQLALWRGNIAEAHELAEKSRSRFKRINDSYGLVQATVPLLRAQIALGRNTAAQRTTEELAALADSSRNGPMPLQALAGAAMHRGRGADVIDAVDRATNAMQAIGSRSPEPIIMTAVAHLQLGNLDDALVALDSIHRPSGGAPFGDAAAALVYAAAGRPDRALELADAVEAASGGTYLDDVFALVARAAASNTLGDRDTAIGAAEQAALRASGAGDVVATALATEVFRSITGDEHPAHDSRHPLSEGWRTAVRLLVGGD
jgi:tetratricopeptide (TPR) repeat protein